jgi:hypothetical protein
MCIYNSKSKWAIFRGSFDDDHEHADNFIRKNDVKKTKPPK